ncbi:hypothetical protein JNK62_03540 [bacterium]|nr:hypothetical protein [bacterium]
MSKLGMLAILATSIPFAGAVACDDHAEATGATRQPTDCVDSDMVYSEGAKTIDTSIDGQPLKQVCVIEDGKGVWKDAK